MKLRVNRDIAALLQEVRTSVNGRERGEQQDTISWDELKDLYRQSGYASRGIRLKTICQGSSIEPDKTVSLGSVGGQKKSPELVKHLEQFQILYSNAPMMIVIWNRKRIIYIYYRVFTYLLHG